MENGKRLDLIDRNDYFKRLRIVRMSSKLLDRNGVLNLAEIALEEAPTVDAVEVVHGRWENQHGIYSCSVCGKSNPYEVLMDNIWYWPCNYCPNCGAKMDGDGNA